MMMTLGCFCVVLGFMTPDPSYPVRAQAEIDRYIDLSAQVCACKAGIAPHPGRASRRDKPVLPIACRLRFQAKSEAVTNAAVF
jgi:hypothetical protein